MRLEPLKQLRGLSEEFLQQTEKLFSESRLGEGSGKKWTGAGEIGQWGLEYEKRLVGVGHADSGKRRGVRLES